MKWSSLTAKNIKSMCNKGKGLIPGSTPILIKALSSVYIEIVKCCSAIFCWKNKYVIKITLFFRCWRFVYCTLSWYVIFDYNLFNKRISSNNKFYFSLICSRYFWQLFLWKNMILFTQNHYLERSFNYIDT